MKAEGTELGLNMELPQGYWKGLVQGQMKTERRVILRHGTKRLGEPGDRIIASIKGIASLEALESIWVRLMRVESRNDLLS